MEKITAIKNAIHYLTVPCGASSIFGVQKTKDKKKVTCKTCLRCLKASGEKSKYLKNPCENNWYCKDCGEVNCEC